MEPKYRMRVEIYDDECGETVVKMDEPMYSQEEDNIANAFRAMDAFSKNRSAHEETYYPKETV